MICPHCGKDTDPAPAFQKFPMMLYKSTKDKDDQIVISKIVAEDEAAFTRLAKDGYGKGQPASHAVVDSPVEKTTAPKPVVKTKADKKKGAHS